MDLSVITTSILIFFARVTDVSLGTLRTAYVIQGRRELSWILGFLEVLIWVYAVSEVIHNLTQPIYAISFALGFSTGNYLGITLEKWFALGSQIIRVFTHEGEKISATLRAKGLRLTSFTGNGRDGPIDMLFIGAPRRKVPEIQLAVRELDPKSYIMVDDLRADQASILLHQPTGWRAILKKK